MKLLESFLLLGTAVAAVAIGVICLVGLIVWLAGGKPPSQNTE